MRPLRIVAWIAGPLLALLALAGVTLIIGVNVDVGFLKPRLAAWVSAHSDWRVDLQGPLRLTVAFTPVLTAERVAIHPAGDEAQDPLLELDAVALQLAPRPGVPTQFSLRIEHPAAWLSAAGTLEQMTAPGPLDVHLALTSKAPGVATPFRITGRLQDHERGYQLEKLLARVANTEVSGDVLLDTGAARPLLVADLDIPHLDLEPAAGDPGQPAESESAPAAPPRLRAAITPLLAVLDELDADLRVGIGRIGNATLEANDISLALTLRDGQITELPFAFVYQGNSVTGNARCDLRPALAAENGAGQEAPLPFELQVEAAGTSAEVRGDLATLAAREFTLDVAVGGDSLQQLSPLLQTRLPALGPWSIRSRVTLARHHLRLEDINARLKDSDLGGELDLHTGGARPRLSARLSAQRLVVEDLLNEAAGDGVPLDSGMLDAIDARVHAQIYQLRVADRDLRNVRLEFEFREGRVRNAPFALNLDGMQIAGDASLDIRGKVPAVQLKLNASGIDTADLPGLDRLPAHTRVQVEKAHLEFSSAGNILAELRDRSTVAVTLRNARVEYSAPALPRPLSIGLAHANLESSPGRPIRLTAEGLANGLPASVTLAVTRPPQLAQPLPDITADLRLNVADASLSLTGKLLPVSDSEPQPLVVTLNGGRMDRLKPLLGDNLPSLGPYGLRTTVIHGEQRIALPDASLRLGSSLIELDLLLDTSGERPAIQARLDAERVLLDDFMKIRTIPAAAADAAEETPAPAYNEEEGAQLPKLMAELDDLSLNTLNKFDADIELKITALYTEEGFVEDIDAHARLVAGRLELKPLAATLPGGRIDVRLMVDEDPDTVEVDLGIDIERFDFGPLMRRLAPRYAGDGWLGADIALRSRAASYGALLSNASGHLNLAIWPDDVGTAFFDFWGTGLIADVFTRFLPGTSPTLNCVVGYFDLNDGIATTRAFVMDDTRITVRGDGTINLREGTVDMIVIPTPKDPGIIEIRSPQRISGSLRDPARRSARGVPIDAVDTAVRVPVNVITFPFRLMLREPIPRDGTVTCAPQE